MNSTQHSINRSRVSLAKDMDCAQSSAALEARTSLMIFWTVALGRERSSLPSSYGSVVVLLEIVDALVGVGVNAPPISLSDILGGVVCCCVENEVV